MDTTDYAKEYAKLGITDSFYLAYRDLPHLVEKYVKGKEALDYGCGGGRSTRFLKKLGLNVVGVDTLPSMIQEARSRDPQGKYYLITSGDLTKLGHQTFDLILSVAVFIAIPSLEEMARILSEMKRVLRKEGTAIIITGTADIYTRNWASFICNFPENRGLNSGDQAKVVIRGTNITLYDYLWTDEDYKQAISNAGLRLIKTHQPMPTGKEPYTWHSETKHPLWTIYILKK
ncbi:MAG: class I SAM-dependent methyltransferase [Nanoarchaeota archaeon]